MILNNIELDVKVKCLEADMTHRIIKQKKDGIINKTFVSMLEALGYDIELTYRKRDEK